MSELVKPRILCVDDEPNVLGGIALNVRKEFEMLSAGSGEEALKILDAEPNICVVMSDMRMPKMSGAVVLARAKASHPEVTRLLLTGQSDMTSAISAINEGQIFRFLTKPCDRDRLLEALRCAVDQHRLVTSERVLLQDTLQGAIAALVDVLALTNPIAFGRSSRVKARAAKLAAALAIPDRWQVEMAASLQHLGYIALPHETIEKVHAGQILSDEEHKMVARLPVVTEQLLAHIPRLEAVRAILTAASRPAPIKASPEDAVELGGAILRVAADSDTLESAGTVGHEMIAVLGGRKTYDARVLDALAQLLDDRLPRTQIVELSLNKLRPGMVVAEDLKMANGNLLVAHGYEITLGFLERVRNFPPGAIREPVRVTTMVD